MSEEVTIQGQTFIDDSPCEDGTAELPPLDIVRQADFPVPSQKCRYLYLEFNREPTYLELCRAVYENADEVDLNECHVHVDKALCYLVVIYTHEDPQYHIYGEYK